MSKNSKRKKNILPILIPLLGGSVLTTGALIPLASCAQNNNQNSEYVGKLVDVTISGEINKTTISGNNATVSGSNFMLDSETDSYKISITIEIPKIVTSYDKLIVTLDGENQQTNVTNNQLTITSFINSEAIFPLNLPYQIKWNEECGEFRDSYVIVIKDDTVKDPVITDGPIITFVVNEDEQFKIKSKSLPDSTTKFRIDQIPESPTFKTYLFRGWYTEPDGKGNKINLINQIFTSEQTLYAKWVSILHFETNGAGIPFNDIEVNRNEILDVTDYNINIDRNYIFDGWYTDKNLEKGELFDTVLLEGETTVYAKWVSQLIFHNGSATKTVYVEKGEAFDFNSLNLDFGNYHLEAWCSDEQLQKPVSDPFVPEGNMNLYPKLYTNLSFDTDGGDPIEPIRVYKGQEIRLYDIQAHLDTYTFRGWYPDKSATGTNVEKLLVLNDTTLYASYTGKIIFNCADGSVFPEKSFIKNQSVTLTEEITIENYRFGGWTTKNKDANTLVSTFVPSSGEMNVYAYIVSDVKLVNGETYQKDKNVEVFYEDAIIYNAPRGNYTFDGLYTEPEFVNKVYSIHYVPKGHMTLYVKWVSIVVIYNPKFLIGEIIDYKLYSENKIEAGKSIIFPDMPISNLDGVPDIANDGFFDKPVSLGSDYKRQNGEFYGNKGEEYTPTGNIVLYGQYIRI